MRGVLRMWPVLCALALFSGGCRDAAVTSAWMNGNIVVDGLYHDWTGLSYFDKPSMFIGARNDGENLYLIVKTVDQRAQWKVMRLGMTVWIEPEGHPERVWGVHYPVGLADHGIPVYGAGVPERSSPGLNLKMAEMLGTMEFLGPDAGRRVECSLDAAGESVYGIRAAVRDTSGVIVYEMRVPLRGDDAHPYAVWAVPGGRLNLRFVTGDIRDPQKKTGAPSAEDPNRDTSTGRIKDKGRDREQEQRMSQRRTPMFNPLAEPIEFRMKLTLAAE